MWPKRSDTKYELHYWGVSVRVKREISFPTVQTAGLYDAYEPRELPKRAIWRVHFRAIITGKGTKLSVFMLLLMEDMLVITRLS